MPSVSGGGAGLSTVAVTLTNAQIKALPTTSIPVIAAPGANKMVVVVASIWTLDATHGAYTNLAGLGLALGYGASPLPLATNDYEEAQQGAFADTSAVHTLGFAFVNDGAGKALWLGDRPQVANTAVVVQSAGTTGDLTGGNAANTLTVSATYVIIGI